MTVPEVLSFVLFAYSLAVLLRVLRSVRERGWEVPDVLLAFDAENTAEARRAAVHQDVLRRRMALVRACEERVYGPEVHAEEPPRGGRAAVADPVEGARMLAELRGRLADLDAERDRRIAEVDREAAATLDRRRAAIAAAAPYDRALRAGAWACLAWLAVVTPLSLVL
ncbi:hypothetical protein ACFPZ0_05355 [Streptomonospora nanhaiensis]|uniref:Acetolactate synthase regulatory subunit n=1 Tax=Streptomonospora nanhaiensis TaxID=1323731 RepID=A0A853BIU2_9ACTN|nr:hypothetical protein [Streptomonospora nanhaiensis]MBV2365040.1 hypothetical protein [Streptomonospora nanhaiensis]MBX9388291.1 hypothetical protein [Streptomonospora nanhaiensis]NYI94502.1 acetolactate synthase regulatory subunit [Streptomonospora nanhaiensis]